MMAVKRIQVSHPRTQDRSLNATVDQLNRALVVIYDALDSMSGATNIPDNTVVAGGGGSGGGSTGLTLTAGTGITITTSGSTVTITSDTDEEEVRRIANIYGW